MSRLDTRTDRLYGDLTATERAVMVLQAWKRNEQEDPKVRATIPSRWAGLQFNHLIAVMNAVNTRMGLYVVELAHSVDLLTAELQWLQAIDLWSNDVAQLGLFIDLHGKTPIGESDHRALVEAERARWAPLAELAEVLVEKFDGWAAADMTRDDAGDEFVTDAAWARREATIERELRALVKQGVLRGRRSREGLVIGVGSFCDWSGEPPFVFPEWGPPYEVRPDAEAESARRTQRALEHVRETLATVPRLRLERHLATTPDSGVSDAAAESAWDRILALKVATAQQRWRELRAVELQFEAVGREEFQGEDPELPAVRHAIDSTKAKLQAVREVLATVEAEFEFEEPTEDDLAVIRGMYNDAVERES